MLVCHNFVSIFAATFSEFLEATSFPSVWLFKTYSVTGFFALHEKLNKQNQYTQWIDENTQIRPITHGTTSLLVVTNDENNHYYDTQAYI